MKFTCIKNRLSALRKAKNFNSLKKKEALNFQLCGSLVDLNRENKQKALFRFLAVQKMHFLSLKILYVFLTEIKDIFVKAI